MSSVYDPTTENRPSTLSDQTTLSSFVGKTVASVASNDIGPTLVFSDGSAVSAAQLFTGNSASGGAMTVVNDNIKNAAVKANASPDPYFNDTSIP